MQRSFRTFAVVLTALAPACALPAPGAAQARDTTPGVARGVAPGVAVAERDTTPDQPPLAAFLDSAGLVRAVAALALPEPPPNVKPLFWVLYDTTGAVRSVDPVFSQLPAAYAGPVAAAIRASLKPQAPSRRPIYTHLRVVAGSGAVVDRPALRFQQPVLANRNEVTAMLRRVVNALDTLPEPEYRAHVRMRVLADGSVDSMSVVRSTGRPWLDQEAARIAGQARFTPASVERTPVRLWAVLPITFRTRDWTRLRGYNSPGLDVFLWVNLPWQRGRDAANAAPPLSVLIDSAALVRAAAGLPRNERAIFRLSFDTAGAVKELAPMFDQLAASEAEALLAAIRPLLKPQPASTTVVDTYLRVLGGPQPVVDRPVLAQRAPVLRNPEEIMRLLSEARRRHGARPSVTLPQYVLSVRADGRPDEGSIEVMRSSGTPELDHAVVRVLGRMRFRPAVIEGVTVATPVRVPIYFRGGTR